MDLLQWLEEWYQAQCDGSWEHLFGVSVVTLDNPGWHVEIDIEDTDLMNKEFNEIWYDKGTEDWLICRINQGKFDGAGDPKKLLTILQIFKAWVEHNKISMLKYPDIKTEPGISQAELKKIEELYGIRFPKSMREFLMEALPVSNGFYNWRDFSEENINTIKSAIAAPIEALIELAEEAEWCESWGKEPESVAQRTVEVKERLQKAPTLIPVYAHRYVPMVEAENPPVLSVHGTDVVYYGENLADYFDVEFGGKKQQNIAFERILAVPFWSEIM